MRTLQRGLTLIELMVAMVLLLLVTLATATLYTVNAQSSRTIDANAYLDDNARYAFETIGQAIRNSGYREFAYSTKSEASPAASAFDGCTATEACPIIGFDNSKVTTGTTDFGEAGTGLVNGSDSLAIRFSGSGTGAGDGSMIDCLNVSIPRATLSASNPSDTSIVRGQMGLSAFWVNNANTEPELMCTSFNPVTSARNSQPIVRGVESFQIAYGLDVTSDGIPDRWVSAANVTSWKAVRAIRIGLVLRGAVGSAQATQNQTQYPLGESFDSTVSYTPGADTRIRRNYITTFFLRNEV